MPRYNVEHKGKWACFTSISDGFITPFMELEDFEQWRKEEYGRGRPLIEQANKMSMDEALFSMIVARSRQDILKELEEIGYKP